ncbi:hypothetical protein M2222_006203 [Bradyrhizobium elkanii]|nr:hypothetical protein [Bradyrhizobium elkanii]MCS3563881.1 hypothetical protein [Bradyrhizobium elkanii]MCW2146287.1 hypothetical protein [Bradyrhizobium elkanii]MCW2379114.1 hypothetical protein [Bradyrhizobium elkanii]
MRKAIGTTIIIVFVTYFFFGSTPFVQVAEFAKGLVDEVTGSRSFQLSGPDFKVRHRVQEVETNCRYNPTGTQCLQHDHASVRSLSIQSANDYPVLLKEIVINEKPQCSVKLPRGNQGDSGASIRMRELRRARDAGRA